MSSRATRNRKTKKHAPHRKSASIARSASGNKQTQRTERPWSWRQGAIMLALVTVGLLLWQGGKVVGRQNKSATKSATVSAQPAPQPKLSKLLTGKKAMADHDVPYCNGQKLDVYYPRQVKGEKAPVVMYIHGGGWEINDKASEKDQLARIDGLRDHGFIIVSIDYRKMPDNYFPAPVEDALCAVRFLRAHAAEYDIDVKHIGAYGFSSGGYLAAMTALLPKDSPYNTGEYVEQSSHTQAVATLGGVLDFENGLLPYNKARIERFLNAAPAAPANPITYVNESAPPFLLIHGVEDQFVPMSQDINFEQALKAKNAKVRRLEVKQADHGLNQRGDALMSPSRQQTRSQLHEFFKRHLLS